MKLKRLLQIGSLLSIICLVCTSCMSVDYPRRTQYMLNLETPTPVYHVAPNKILAVHNVTVEPPFNGLSFIYRTSDVVYTKDYYHVFLNPPAQQIEQSIIQYLQATNLFSYVSDDIAISHPTYVMYADVLELYADYRDVTHPKAFISVKFTVFNPNKGNKIVMAKTYNVAVPLSAKNSQSLFKAWNVGLAKVLRQLTANLKKV